MPTHPKLLASLWLCASRLVLMAASPTVASELPNVLVRRLCGNFNFHQAALTFFNDEIFRLAWINSRMDELFAHDMLFSGAGNYN